jgi:hypothetical protein
MIGQDFSGARRVVVLIEMDGGMQHGWEIIQPREVRWEWSGLVRGSTHARINVEGEFHRMSREGIGEHIAGEIIEARGEIADGHSQ